MSNIYITEPPTNGKVLLQTSVGDIEIELWSKESPKAARNFVQLCMEGYYDRTVFHRLVPDFIVQGGDPTGTGEGGECIYEKPFKTEIHSRLRFNRRGLVAMSAGAQDDNRSQFFFTLAATPELDRKHTIFGKVVGNTLYNMINLGNGDIDQNERPVHLHRIFRTEMIDNPFPDIVPRVVKGDDAGEGEKEAKQKSTARATKNFSLLSFGEEAEEEEEELTSAQEEMRSKQFGKSSHDLLDDPRLSKDVVAVERRPGGDSPEAESRPQTGKKRKNKDRRRESDAEEDGEEGKEPTAEDKKRKVRDEIAELQRELAKSRRRQTATEVKTEDGEEEEKPAGGDAEETAAADDPVARFKAERQKFKSGGRKKKKNERESDTMALFERFQAKLFKFAEDTAETTAENGEPETTERLENYLKHRMVAEEKAPVLAMDASSAKDHERYDLYDPRNSLNKRRRNKK